MIRGQRMQHSSFEQVAIGRPPRELCPATMVDLASSHQKSQARRRRLDCFAWLLAMAAVHKPPCPGLSGASTALQSWQQARTRWPEHARPDRGSPMAAALPDIPLPPGIRSRTIEGINGLTMHVLEAG